MANHITRASWSTLFSVVVTDSVLTLVAIAAVNSRPLGFLDRASLGLIPPGLVLSLLNLAIVVGIMMLWLGKLKLTDIGLIWPNMRTGMIFAAVLWVLSQCAHIIIEWLTTRSVAIHPPWAEARVTLVIGDFLFVLIGVADEEIIFRGLLFVQLYLIFAHRLQNHRTASILIALVASQIMFALSHMPVRLYEGVTGSDLWPSLIRVFGFGVFLTFTYVWTDNLFVVIALHTLLNRPIAVFIAPFDSHWLVFIVSILLVLAWPYSANWHRDMKSD